MSNFRLLRLTISAFVMVTLPAAGVAHSQPPATPALPEFTPAADGGLGSTATREELDREQIQASQTFQAVWLVDSAAEPQPAMRYRFWPAAGSLQPGSGQSHFSRAVIAVLTRDGAARTINELSGVENPDWDAVRALIKSHEPVLAMLREMAYSQDLGWDGGPWRSGVTGTSAYWYGFDHIQQARLLARLLVLKARLHLHDGDFDATGETVLIGFRLSSLIGQGDNLIQKLVGIAISAMMRGVIEQMIQTPDSPNLYWAIVSVPTPVVSIQEAMEQELNGIQRAFPDLAQARSAGWTEDEARRRWTNCIAELAKVSGPVTQLSNLSLLRALDPTEYLEPARARLKTAGVSDEELAALAPTAIVMADAALELERHTGDLMKSVLLTGRARSRFLSIDQPGAMPGLEQFEDQKATSGAALFLSLLGPSVRQAQAAEARLPTMLRRLATLEAIRMHVASHDGTLPESLDVLSPVPAIEAFDTELPFEFQIEEAGGQRTLILSGDIAGFEAARHLRFQFRQK